MNKYLVSSFSYVSIAEIKSKMLIPTNKKSCVSREKMGCVVIWLKTFILTRSSKDKR
jgi:hypothetical protein